MGGVRDLLKPIGFLRAGRVSQDASMRGFGLCVPIALWLAALLAGWWWITAYEFDSKQISPDSFANSWPVDTALKRPDGRSALLVFLHPKCPCARATVAELEKVLDRLRPKHIQPPELFILATIPESQSESWCDTALVRRAAKLPQATLIVDRGGVEAARFGATTSGAVMLFDSTAGLRYAGGITSARGSEGDNLGRASLETILEGGGDGVTGIPVFGCRLCLPADTHNYAAASAVRQADDR